MSCGRDSRSEKSRTITRTAYAVTSVRRMQHDFGADAAGHTTTGDGLGPAKRYN
jgi:hypothetical protein